MKLVPCRDCGELVPADARGCPKCARNMEAERMLERFFWRVLVPFSVILAGLVVGFWLYRSQ